MISGRLSVLTHVGHGHLIVGVKAHGSSAF
jgi:hypothetical protein